MTDGTVAVGVCDPRSGMPRPPLLYPEVALRSALGADGVIIATTCRDNCVRVFAAAPAD